MNFSQKSFKLVVWRPANIERPLSYIPEFEGGSLEQQGQPFDCTYLQEQLYQWDPGEEDVWSSLAISVSSLREDLLIKFAPHLKPSLRSMSAFREYLDSFDAALHESSWSTINQSVEAEQDEYNIKANLARSFYNHLNWILSVFEHVPGASVSVQ